MEAEVKVAFFCVTAYGSPANMAPYFCVARAAEAGGGGGGGCFFSRIWESRDHGTQYFFCFFALRAHGSPAIMAPYFCVVRTCGGGTTVHVGMGHL